jgi:hypothetical protein
MRPTVALVLVLVAAHGSARADEASSERCGPGPYLQPALTLALGLEPTSTLLAGASFGMIVRPCRGGWAPTDVQFGLAVIRSLIYEDHELFGIGGELAASRRINQSLRIGAHVSFAGFEGGGGGVLATYGLRAHLYDRGWVGVGAGTVIRRCEYVNACESVGGRTSTGLLIGAGIEGRLGTVLGAVTLVTVALSVVASATAPDEP